MSSVKNLAVGQNLPSVAVGAGYNYHNLLDANTTFGMVFATVSVPISDWWAGSHAIKRRKIEHQKAVEQLEDNSQLLQIRMQNAWNGVEEAYQQLLLAQRSIEQATENLRLNRNYYNAGISKLRCSISSHAIDEQMPLPTTRTNYWNTGKPSGSKMYCKATRYRYFA